MEDVEAWQAIYQETLDAIIDRLGCLSAHLTSLILYHAIKGFGVPL